ncbi:MAG: replication factor C large subunit [Candidatus Bathyarchaeota archaeon]|nr:replication factor C large subunit [Candidatus Bathyarchaeota archaeon]
MSTIWTQKHKPQTLTEIVGNKDAKQQFLTWLKSWSKGIPKKRAAFLHGSPGVGKTVTVETLAKELNMELVEKNASDYRTADAIKRFAGLASQYATLFGGNRLILLDEVDGITGKEDRGGVRELTNILKTTRSPVVLTANNAYNPRFSTIRKYCLIIPFKKPTVREVVSHLKRICAKEGIAADEEALKFIAERSGRDVRSAVNDLQALAQEKKRLVIEDVVWLAGRDRKEVIFDVLRTILYSKDSWEAKKAVSNADVDPDMLFNWIYENTPYHLTDPHDLAKAMNYLALADIYRKRIRTTQYWSLLRYVVDFMSSGVAVARQRTKSSGWIPFRFPEKIRLLSRTKGERALQTSIGMKIRRRCHMSAVRSIKEAMPYLKIIFENNSEMAAGLSKWLDLDEDMIEYLAGNKKQTKTIIAKLA